MADNRIYTCTDRTPDNVVSDIGQFFPVLVGSLSPTSQKIEFGEGRCFESINFWYDTIYNGTEVSEVTVWIEAEKPRSLLCNDWFFFGSSELYQVETIFYSGKHSITFKNLSPSAKKDLGFGGLHVFMFCGGYIDTFISVFKTLLGFIGGLSSDPTYPIIGSHVPFYMEYENVLFLNKTMGYHLEERTIQEVQIDPDTVNSGDFFAIMRLDGIDPLIMYGSGTHSGHSVMALKIEGELYIVESQDGWYWPTHGIQKTKYSQWMEFAKNADFHVAHLPLSAEARAKFNETAAVEFYLRSEGLPYGYHNFLMGWVDTPTQNWPPLLPPGLIPVVFSLLSTIIPSTTDIFIE
jgi:hypothetical protein